MITIVVLGSILVFGANRGVHRSYLQGVQTDLILSRWDNSTKVDVMREYATLPPYDRALIEKHCTPVYDRLQKYLGTTERPPSDLDRRCLALVEGGWIPNWNLERGADVLAGNYVR